eukprot:TRINITY_DN2006_c0_g1_i2.p1 TRINITY_DN2006_c0_g1~~TRINITY_DN2006_c0_g1_i2.p1  ORF type:complete len:630 (-),score=132.46 TRINITY_DN2006_c0_g1_i2:338-2227(-)
MCELESLLRARVACVTEATPCARGCGALDFDAVDAEVVAASEFLDHHFRSEQAAFDLRRRVLLLLLDQLQADLVTASPPAPSVTQYALAVEHFLASGAPLTPQPRSRAPSKPVPAIPLGRVAHASSSDSGHDGDPPSKMNPIPSPRGDVVSPRKDAGTVSPRRLPEIPALTLSAPSLPVSTPSSRERAMSVSSTLQPPRPSSLLTPSQSVAALELASPRYGSVPPALAICVGNLVSTKASLRKPAPPGAHQEELKSRTISVPNLDVDLLERPSSPPLCSPTHDTSPRMATSPDKTGSISKMLHRKRRPSLHKSGEVERKGEVPEADDEKVKLKKSKENDVEVVILQSQVVGGSAPQEDSAGEPLSHREHVEREIVATERTYVDIIRTAVALYEVPLRNAEPPILVKEEIDNIFGNLQTLLGFNEELLKCLTARTAPIAESFIKLTPFFIHYKEYSKQYPVAVKLLCKLRKCNSEFRKFLEKQSKEHSNFATLDLLDSYLITPIQRIPRYNLLLMELIKTTDETDPEMPLLKRALEMMLDVADAVNTSSKTEENQKKLLAIQQSLVFPEHTVEIVEPQRQLVKEGELALGKQGNAYVFLFNDCIMFAKKRVMSSSLTFQKKALQLPAILT